MFRLAGCLFLSAFSLLLLSPDSPALAQDTPLMTKEELKSRLSESGLALIDVRPDDQWQLSPNKLPGATHEDPFQAEDWGEKYARAETIVLYCA
jgi:rhodanese-related sulfurtransferase